MQSDPPTASIRFATRADALCIAEMSRDYIEYGLGWNWTRDRILRSLRHHDTNAIVAIREADRAGFAIMKYGDEEAHLLLLAIKPSHRRRGVGRGHVPASGSTNASAAGLSGRISQRGRRVPSGETCPAGRVWPSQRW